MLRQYALTSGGGEAVGSKGAMARPDDTPRRRGGPLAPAWPGSPAEARALQQQMRAQVVVEDRLGTVRRVAGVDAHHDPNSGLTWAAVALVRLDDLELDQSVLCARPTSFPYISGLLSFREAPAILDALERLSAPPDLVLVDGQGIAHPRRLGIASHIGVLTDLPTIGVAKSRLIGRHDEPGPAPGAWAPLIDRGEVVGAVLRSRRAVRPLFVSPGHRIGLATAVALVMRCCRGLRLPEPVRLADRVSRMHPRAPGPAA